MARAGVDTLLKEYRQKRDFTRTAEPDHAAPNRQGGERSFVVQKHDATRLHYDFRLEWEGVLKSWAVTRGPSYDPSEKRLAVRTEDHPLAYGSFEGTIPKDQYGGGTVMLWDRGGWEPVGDFGKGLKEGKIVFRLEGERLKGEWTLVRMKPKPGEKRENWLMIKHREEGVKPPRGDVLKKFDKSVASGRTMTAIAKGGRSLAKSDLVAERPAPSRKSPTGRKGRAAMPRWREPQLATLVDEAPEGDQWLSELKYDGYRTLITIAGGKAKVFTRNGKDWTDKFPSVAEAAARLDVSSALLDGEIVAFDKAGRTDFSSLQKAIKAGGRDLSCFVFDCLELEGEDLTGLALVERKARLETLLGEGSAPLIYSSHVTGQAPKVLAQICSAGHEGIVAKRANDSYRSGRGRSWLKVKCTRRQEFVVGGWRPSDKKGRTVSSLLIGVFDGQKLVYKGRVGAFEGDTLDLIGPLLSKQARKTSPFAGDLPREIRRDARFVTPDLVIEVDFTEFTADGVVRHGVVKGLREDKKAGEVVLEKPSASTKGAMKGSKPMQEHETRDVFAGVKLSSPDKVLFKEQGVTKADLAAHYERVAERILPHVERRLVSLVRCPDGASGQCFFQKHDAKGFPDELKRMEVEESGGKRDTYLYAEDLSALIAGVQVGTLEFHIWGSRIDRLEQPDRLVFDLDPDEGLDFGDVREAAFDMRDRLDKIGLRTVAMVTGGKGVHVIAPLARRAEWPQVKDFARGFATTVAADAPDRYVATMSKAKRKGKIFIDYLRNERGSTAIAPYSTRARKGAPVATPVSWDELASLKAANGFHIGDMEGRLDGADPWADASSWKQSITKTMLKAVDAGD
ncbi:MAG: DNA ligase D [Rhizobiaceae bacterium]|nr:DNA ligase D [Rhizobiaceae bacterium]MCV0407744.1 DNA ligase D [Rhizobiaceae bacterium]